MIDVIILLHEVRQHTSEELRDVTLRSSTNLTGTDNGLCRSLYKAMGYSEEELTNRPVIGIANSWSTLVPGHYNLRELADFVRKGIYRAGGTAVEFGVTCPHPHDARRSQQSCQCRTLGEYFGFYRLQNRQKHQ